VTTPSGFLIVLDDLEAELTKLGGEAVRTI